MQTIAQAQRAAQSFEDARLAEHLGRQDAGEMRLCGSCGEATPFDGADVFTLMRLLPHKCGKPTREAIDGALRQCLWCCHLGCVVGEGDEACDRWSYYGDGR